MSPTADSADRARAAALPFGSAAELEAGLRANSYLPSPGLATAVYLALALGRPLLLEGEAGVGKTEVANVLAALLGRELIRLQCYEGIDANQALYEWDYSRQLVAIRAAEAGGPAYGNLFGPEFLVERPLLAAIRRGPHAVLLIDELDRADDELEAYLLELLSDFAVTVPEVGRIAAPAPPAIVITSNRTRELHDALKRRCLYHWIDHPTIDREVEIVRMRAPQAAMQLAEEVAAAVARLRGLDLGKRPGVAETIDWVRALAFLGVTALDVDTAEATLGSVVKNRDDQELVRPRLAEVLGQR